MGNVDNLVGGFRSSLKKQRPQKNPIQDHPLASADDEVRKMYIDTLCVVAQYENENAEKELAFVERIHSGAGLTNNFSEHIDGVNDISSEQLHAFIEVCKKNKLENNFVLDCMLTAQADGKHNEEQYGFASDLAEALGLKGDRVLLLSEFADVISEKDSEKYRELYEKLNPADAAEVIGGAIGYIKEFVSGVLIDTPELFWISSQKREEYVVDDGELPGYIKVVVENATIKSTLGFRDCKSVILKNCVVNKPISFSNIDSAAIDDCDFNSNGEKGESSILIKKVSSLSIDECKFSDMVFENNNNALISFSESKGCTIHIEKTSFFNLRSKVGEVILAFNRSGGGGIMRSMERMNSSPSLFSVKNCDFTNCCVEALFQRSLNNSMRMLLEDNTYSNCCRAEI